MMKIDLEYCLKVLKSTYGGDEFQFIHNLLLFDRLDVISEFISREKRLEQVQRTAKTHPYQSIIQKLINLEN